MASSGLRVAVACEDQAHRALATFLADRVLLDEAISRGADWIDAPALEWLRSFGGRGGGEQEQKDSVGFYPLSRVEKDASDIGNQLRIGGRSIRDRGFIHGKPLQPEARMWRRLLLLFAGEQPPPDALIVVRDTDGHPERLAGMKQALELEWPFPIIVAAPHQDAEAWFVAGFAPLNEQEVKRLGELRNELSFSPPEEPHRLTAHPNHAPTDAKRVLRMLLFDENQSRPPSVSELPEVCERTLSDLNLLEQRGQACGLVEFLQALKQRFVPLFIKGPPPG